MALFFAVACLQVLLLTCHAGDEIYDFWTKVGCTEEKVPDNCDLSKIPLVTVEDISRCAPATLPPFARNYYLGWGGRGVTYRENKKAYGNIFIKGRVLRDVSDTSLEVTTLGQNVAFPIGISPTALLEFTNPSGENATAGAATDLNTIMILSSYASNTLEEVASHVRGKNAKLWFQTYVFTNKQFTIDAVRRAERNGYKAIVLTVDSYTFPPVFCDAKKNPNIRDAKMGNFPVTFDELIPVQMRFSDITWLKSITHLPIVAKGITTGEDAVLAIRAGASAVMVSNHGGRQLDGLPATIDALPDVVKAVRRLYPPRDVYVDGGIRNGYDVYKAMARGAKMAFVGRPAVWGATLDGEKGVKRVLEILKKEFNETMILSGNAKPSDISGQDIIPSTNSNIFPIDSPGQPLTKF